MSVAMHRTETVSPHLAPLRASPETPAGICRIILTLARCPDPPGGCLDAAVWRETRDHCRVRRCWIGARDRHGRLVHHDGGEDGATWRIDDADWTNEDDVPGSPFGTQAFVEGEPVSICGAPDQTDRTLRVAYVGPVEAEARP